MAAADVPDVDMHEDDNYDEEADSDFDAAASGEAGEISSSSSDDELESGRPRKRRKVEKTPTHPKLDDLDSGDEATIKEQRKARRRRKDRGEDGEADSGNESEGWKAKTRAMREREKDERRQHRLASSKHSTIDVDKLWAEMNSAKPLKPPLAHNEAQGDTPIQDLMSSRPDSNTLDVTNKENIPAPSAEEMITIKRTYKFAGEVHTEEKTVPKSSAEARLWLSQQGTAKPQTEADSDGKAVQRPLRKVSRFDPNLTNLAAFKVQLGSRVGGRTGPSGPKLNVVEKSKMDWAVHVDTEGLKDELDEHAKAKEGYLNRMDFLGEVEQRKEAEARAARLRGL